MKKKIAEKLSVWFLALAIAFTGIGLQPWGMETVCAAEQQAEYQTYTETEMQSALNNIYENLLTGMEVSDPNMPWVIADIKAYENANGTAESVLSAEQMQSYVNYVAEQGLKTDRAGDLAKYIISLKALGYDASHIACGFQNIDLTARLRKMADEKSGGVDSIYTAPYVLIALQQDEAYAAAETTDQVVSYILEQQFADGGFGYSYGGEETVDLDAISPVVSALSKYYGSDEKIKTAVDKALAAALQEENRGDSGAIVRYGSDNASSTGLLLCALASVGRSYQDYKVSDTYTMADGLMGLLNAEKNGFLFQGNASVFATEQGFRGLLSALNSKNQAYRIYDFSAAGSESAEVTEFQVSFELKTDTEIWIPETIADAKPGDTVKDVFLKVVQEAGLSQKGAENGYVSAITKDGYTLKEFDKGRWSGWMYSVNGVEPDVGLADYRLLPGDSIRWYYVPDPSWSDKKDDNTSNGTADQGGQNQANQNQANQNQEKTEVNGAGNKTKQIVLKKQKIKSLKSTAKRSMTVKVTKNKKASGYQIRYSANKKLKKAKKITVSGRNKTTYRIKKLKSGRKYYVQVRSYKKSGGKKIYGAWSNVKSVKVK